MVITFDEFYDVQESNGFINNLIDNNIEFSTYILTRSPYYWFYEVADKYKPVFLKYSEATSTDIRLMLPKIRIVAPPDYNYLRRISKNPSDIEKYISPNIFKKAKNSDYFCCFKYSSISYINGISNLGFKIYIYPKKVREWNIAFCFDRDIRDVIMKSSIVFEKTKASDFSRIGEIELYLNNRVFISDKLRFKVRYMPYSENGVYHPLIYQIKN